MKFEPMPKMPRLNKDVIVTEKIDGTNAQVAIELVTREQILQMPKDNKGNPLFDISAEVLSVKRLENDDHFLLRAGSKNRWLTPQSDNFGFAKWCVEHLEELFKLGPGIHRGEFWGKGINRGYGLEERRFSLFNVSRWADRNVDFGRGAPLEEGQQYAPACCHVVPVCGRGQGFEGIMAGLGALQQAGSQAAPGFDKPEGIVAYHTAANLCFKATIENDLGKWAEAVQETVQETVQ